MVTALQPRPVVIVESTPRMSLQQAIGASLRAYRKASGLLLKNVAGVAGISVGHLCEIERGEKQPHSEVLADVCQSMGVAQAIIIKDAADRLELNELLNGERDD